MQPIPSQSAPGAQHNESQRGGRGREKWSSGWRGRGRPVAGRSAGDLVAENSTAATAKQRYPSKTPRLRPTHFLALPLHDHPDLRAQISTFQSALFAATDVQPPPQSTLTNTAQTPGATKPKGKGKARISSIVQGLDSSIVIDPVRMHMTLGVMTLEPEVDEGKEDAKNVTVQPTNSPGNSVPQSSGSPVTTQEAMSPSTQSSATIPPAPSIAVAGSSASPEQPEDERERRTVSTALALLRSLQPEIREILDGEPSVKVPLEVMDVLKTERMRVPKPSGESVGEVQLQQQEEESRVGAGVLFLGPKVLDLGVVDEERMKLEAVCDLIHRTFKEARYITDTRPLKLHCTILNASHRKPMRRIPFCYSDVLSSAACDLIRVTDALPAEQGLTSAMIEADSTPEEQNSGLEGTRADDVTPTASLPPDEPSSIGPGARETRPPKSRSAPLAIPPPLPINLGTYDVREVQLWVMGSRGPDGGYVSLGGVSLGGTSND
ncbi:hypothetical protein NLJ89_g9436 [Agrocybe chaxingu]|uniref:A-kinase anchor protein 7-like phosphoesterase domain-containing protein n=1 Tax=Agrocybe chaxingu TaxID=84603 RepID=A0A9W8JSG1_9AGAR|nr:hypothetical protein NLJ89_g9436 [Agrocybe chaxingu]